MIRANDLATSAPLWARPLPAGPSRAETRDAAAWFDAVAGDTGPAICGDVPAASRGLSMEQHADRVLALLREDRDPRA